MAYKVPTTGGGRNWPAPSSSETEKTEADQEREQQAWIKRPVKEKKIDLESFDQRKPTQRTAEQVEKTRKELISLTKRGAGPLRLREVEVDGNIVLHLAPRTWGQYFYEKLWLFPAEKEARRLEVRAAIERYIRPWLERNEKEFQSADGDGNTPATANNSKATAHTAPYGISNLELLDRLHCRVYTKRIGPAAFFGNTPKVPKS